MKHTVNSLEKSRQGAMIRTQSLAFSRTFIERKYLSPTFSKTDVVNRKKEEPQIISQKTRVHIERPDATTVVGKC